MIVNNSTFPILMEIPLDMVFNIFGVVIIMILILLGVALNIKSTKTFLKSLFHKYLLLVLPLVMLWSFGVYWIFGSYLIKFYSNVVILLTLIFSTFILCFTSYKWACDDSFIKNMVLDNFKIYSIFEVVIGLVPVLFSFNLSLVGLEFIKSLILPLILDVLFLPLMYILAVLNEYVYTNNIYSKSIIDVFKKCNLNLKCIHRFNKQLNYKIYNNQEIKILSSNQSDFRLENNNIYMGENLIGTYECDVVVPNIAGKMKEAYTIEKHIYYVVGDYELENLDENKAFVYFKYGKIAVKLFVEIKYGPMHIWSPLIEDIYEFKLL